MAILAGIDLLAKFYEGDDTTKKGKIGQRFKGFVSKYFQPLSDGDEKIIYQLRNSLLHSFGLYSRDRTQMYHFRLTAKAGAPFVQQPSPGNYQIDLIALHDRFEQALARYMTDLQNQPQLQTNFRNMFRNYGAIRVSPEPAGPTDGGQPITFVSGGIE